MKVPQKEEIQEYLDRLENELDNYDNVKKKDANVKFQNWIERKSFIYIR